MRAALNIAKDNLSAHGYTCYRGACQVSLLHAGTTLRTTVRPRGAAKLGVVTDRAVPCPSPCEAQVAGSRPAAGEGMLNLQSTRRLIISRRSCCQCSQLLLGTGPTGTMAVL